MRRADLIPASVPPPADVVLSLPANLATAMVLVDYAIHGQTTPTPWPYSAAARLGDEGREMLRSVRALLAHGTVLRDFVLARIGAGEPEQREWPAFRRWIAALDADDLEELVVRGILSGLTFYHEHLPRDTWTEAWLERLGTRTPTAVDLEDPAARHTALQALLASWGERDPEGPLTLAKDPDALRAVLLELLTLLWEAGFAESWNAAWRDLVHAVDDVAGLLAGMPALPVDQLVLRVTGLEAPNLGASGLRSAGRLRFVPCLHLGSYLSVTRAGYGWEPPQPTRDLFYVFYEPSRLRVEHDAEIRSAPEGAAIPSAGAPRSRTSVEPMELAGLGPALEALGDSTRLAMLQLLRWGGERLAGQIAEALQVHPSTVSRHFAVLERAGLVRVRREGPVKHYSLDRDRIRAVARLLEQVLG